MNRELRSDSKAFINDVGSVRVPFRARIGRNFAFVPRLGLRLYRFKVLKTLIFYAISELALGEFPVYKNSRVDRVMSYSAKNLIFSSHLEGHGRLMNLPRHRCGPAGHQSLAALGPIWFGGVLWL